MSERHSFFVTSEALGSETVLLDGQEGRHCVTVLRLGPGDEVQLLDGRGRIADAVIRSVHRHAATLSITGIHTAHRPASLPVVAIAFSKAVRRGFFLEKAVELGAWEVWLWQGDHSQGRLPDNARETWQSKMAAGCKQCRNPWMPKVRAFHDGLAGVIQEAKYFEHHLMPWEMQEGVPMLTPQETGLPGRTIYVIGPEGGFSEAEIAVLREAGYRAVSFGRRILRCETAATLCLGLHWWSSQQAGRPDAPRN